MPWHTAFAGPQAPAFCGFIKQSLRVEELDKSLPPELTGCDPRAIDHWKDVLADFVTIWSSYREFWL